MCISLFLPILFRFAGCMDISAELFGGKRTCQRPDPGKPRLPGGCGSKGPTAASKGCRGLQHQISFSFPTPYFCMNLERTRLRSLLYHHAPFFPCQKKPYFGPGLGHSAVGREWAKGPILLCPYLRHGRECSRAIEQEDGKDCCRITMFILR